MSCWLLWINRNKHTFSSNQPTLDENIAISKTIKFISCHKVKSVTKIECILIKWQPPPSDFIKLNTNGEAKKNPGKGGVGGLFRNNQGKIIMGY